MKAVCWHGSKDVRVDTVPEPKIINYEIFKHKKDNCIKVVLKP